MIVSRLMYHGIKMTGMTARLHDRGLCLFCTSVLEGLEIMTPALVIIDFLVFHGFMPVSFLSRDVFETRHLRCPKYASHPTRRQNPFALAV
jgi:hypothetical protein